MAQSYQAGFNIKARVGSGQVWTIQRFSVRETVGDGEVTNSQGFGAGPAAVAAVGFEAHLPLNIVCRVTVTNATFDANENPFDPPLSILTGTWIAVQLFLNGLAGKNWFFPSLLILECDDDADVTRLQPLSWQGVTDGSYNRPA